MTTRVLGGLSGLVAILAVAVLAQQPASPPAFRFERPVVTGGAGPRRLAVDVPLLAGAAPFRVVSRRPEPRTGGSLVSVGGGLQDLRFYDANGGEVGYLLQGSERVTMYVAAATLPITSIDTDDVKASGFEADLGELTAIDRFRIDGLRPPFLKRVKLEASGDRARWTVLVAEGTLFNLPEEALMQTELHFAPGSFRYLRVTWDDTNSARLPRPVAVAAGRVPEASSPSPLLTTPVAFERRPSEPGRSRFRIRLPGGHLPITALILEVGGGHLRRDAKVFQPQLSGSQLTPTMLGQASLARVVRGSLTAADLKIAVEPPTEAQLDLEIDDGDNPPLDLRAVTAEFAQLPWIYVEAPGGTLTARYGNAALTVPHYDLEAMRNQVRIDAVTAATWGDARARTSDENAAAAAPPLPTVGASFEPGSFKYVRNVAAGGAGLIALDLDAAVLAHSAGPARQFSDLRVVDAADRQIPYIVERTPEPLSLDVTVERLATVPKTVPARAGRSVYRVTLPVAGLPTARLVLTTTARVFERAVSVAEEREADAERRRDAGIDMVATAQWIHAEQDKPALPLTLSVPVLRRTELLVIVDDGDNAPLPIAGARILLPSYRLRLFRGAGAHLRVAYGRADLARPQYDLALLAPQVLGAPAADVAIEGERAAAASPTTAAFVSPRLFWGALAIAVVALLALIARLLKKEGAA